ncbi:tRNA-specific adenosine deaminase [Didymella exigua CBS 183.55]|uniref:tRNA-specific adenosine deaminase n=1 Tax=Didymella exigua CBS 183.55 TaxID=1150837 RepID=A0A6A5RBW3_9PLEO|nr:tRNA-specific adenosine deaminase [Didymella exigua CBS 183.55]KAF1924564.1 tRNA-specific adenosine deaminase [Didymella exigua CBS 183.55]
MKCLPHNKLSSANGNILHDWHAEVVAIRTFNRFLLDECLRISSADSHSHSYSHSAVIHPRPGFERSAQEPQPFAIRDDVQILMYCSEAPCGDASMELTMDAQVDATPWTTAPPTILPELGSDSAGALRGRSNFSLLGAVRCKPSRPDAPPTLSKSCTDKLALKQATSLLSSVTSTVISPRNAYIHSLVLPDSQYVPAACERAFSRSGRLQGLTDESIQGWRGGYRWQPFDIKPTQRDFIWSRRSIAVHEKAVASNLSAVSTPSWQETLIGGVLQGRKQMDPRGASKICRRSVWTLAAQIASIVSAPAVLEALTKATYGDIKASEALDARNKVKKDIHEDGLRGWVQNTGDSDFALSPTFS